MTGNLPRIFENIRPPQPVKSGGVRTFTIQGSREQMADDDAVDQEELLRLLKDVQEGAKAEERIALVLHEYLQHRSHQEVRKLGLRWTGGSDLCNSVLKSTMRKIRKGSVAFDEFPMLLGYAKAILKKKASSKKKAEEAEKRSASRTQSLGEFQPLDSELSAAELLSSRQAIANAITQVLSETKRARQPLSEGESPSLSNEDIIDIITALSLQEELNAQDIYDAIHTVVGTTFPSPAFVREHCAGVRRRLGEILGG